jgi:murein DD-endopeptidase MepM/ murein hydrolase activator NlpD
MEARRSKTRSTVLWSLAAAVIFLIAFAGTLAFHLWPELHRSTHVDPALRPVPAVELATLPTATRFDFPIGTEHGAMAYNAQPFTENKHLGDDLNGIGGENSDFGDPVYAVADGRVLLARDGGPGWGNVIIVLHVYEENGRRGYVQSYYGHLAEMLVAPRQDVRRGEKIATVGTANGAYWAHLHFEMREFTTPFLGPGYRQDTRGWLNPSEFIRQHRGAPDDDVGR